MRGDTFPDKSKKIDEEKLHVLAPGRFLASIKLNVAQLWIAELVFCTRASAVELIFHGYTGAQRRNTVSSWRSFCGIFWPANLPEHCKRLLSDVPVQGTGKILRKTFWWTEGNCVLVDDRVYSRKRSSDWETHLQHGLPSSLTYELLSSS